MTCSRWFAVCVDVFEHGMLADGPYDRRSAWLWLVANAAWKDKRVSHKGRPLELKRGQVIIGRSFLAKQWGWSEQNVRTFIAALEDERMIEINQSNGHWANVANICNYDTYQSPESDGNQSINQSPTRDQPEGNQTLTRNTKDDTREREVSDRATTQQVEALEQTASVMRGALPTFGADLVDFVNVGGKPVPTTKAKAYWLERFGGDAARLETALLEATPEIAQKSPMAFSNGVVRRLGQIAGRRMDMAANHAKAVKANANGRKPAFGEDGHEHRVSSETKKFVRPAGYDYPPEAGRGA